MRFAYCVIHLASHCRQAMICSEHREANANQGVYNYIHVMIWSRILGIIVDSSNLFILVYLYYDNSFLNKSIITTSRLTINQTNSQNVGKAHSVNLLLILLCKSYDFKVAPTLSPLLLPTHFVLLYRRP
jgi:hypothetical protein